jgi:hypothetical protein
MVCRKAFTRLGSPIGQTRHILKMREIKLKRKLPKVQYTLNSAGVPTVNVNSVGHLRYTVKKSLRNSHPQPARTLTLGGKNLIIPAQREFGK